MSGNTVQGPKLKCLNCGRTYDAEGYDPLGGDCENVHDWNPLTQRFVCSSELPRPEGAKGRWEHTNVEEVGNQRNGWPSGDDQDYRCKDCGFEWTEELPQ